MEWSATARYRLPGAPGGLGFVQDLLNTRSTRRGDKPDLLAELSSAQRWLDDSLARWSVESGVAQAPVALDGNDLDKLRDLRADLHVLVGQAGRDSAGPAIPSATLGARTTPDGEVLLEPRGEGFRRLAGIVLIEMFNAQRSDAWRRIKVCPQRAVRGLVLRPVAQQQWRLARRPRLRQRGQPARLAGPQAAAPAGRGPRRRGARAVSRRLLSRRPRRCARVA